MFLKVVESVKRQFQEPIYGEGRCFVKIKLNKLNQLTVYGTHLDVYDNKGRTRGKEIEELIETCEEEENEEENNPKNKPKKGPILIAGDFNSVRKCDYNFLSGNGMYAWDLISKEFENHFSTPATTFELEKLRMAGYQDSFTKSSSKPPTFTVW